MPHVDDGTLHAYLDGALDALHEAGALPDALTPADVRTHLAQCADCAARLAAERDIRERAGLILRDSAGTPVTVPPFEVAHPAEHPARRAPRWVPYAWAASLVLAVGAGWWGSQLARQEDITPATNARDAQSPAQREESQPQVQTETSSAPEPQPAATPVPAPPSSLADAEASPTMQNDPAAHRREQQAATPDAPVAEVRPVEVTAERVATRVDSVRSLAGRDAQRSADVLGNPVNQLRGAPLTEQRVAPAAPLPPPPPAPTLSPLARFVGALRAIDDAHVQWRAVLPADTASRDLVGVPGAALISLDVAGAPVTGAIVRVRQRLPSGHVIELLQWHHAHAAVQREATGDVAARTDAGVAVVLDERALDERRRQLVVQMLASGALVALRGDTDLRSLAERLVLLRL